MGLATRLVVRFRRLRSAKICNDHQSMTMKIHLTNLSLALFLGLAGAATVTTFSGCVAGDRYNRSTGEYIDDKGLNARVKNALNDNPEYKFAGVNVVAFKGAVQLSGFVDSYSQKYTASHIAKTVQGVREVDNNITVKEGVERSSGEYVDDKSLAARVNQALGGNPEYKFDEVLIVSLKGTVQLSGFVNTAEQKTRAGELAQQVPGVKEVVNNITVKDKL
jgi:hyperosmotically inducible protein